MPEEAVRERIYLNEELFRIVKDASNRSKKKGMFLR